VKDFGEKPSNPVQQAMVLGIVLGGWRRSWWRLYLGLELGEAG
jgi:hypothetical protein